MKYLFTAFVAFLSAASFADTFKSNYQGLTLSFPRKVDVIASDGQKGVVDLDLVFGELGIEPTLFPVGLLERIDGPYNSYPYLSVERNKVTLRKNKIARLSQNYERNSLCNHELEVTSDIIIEMESERHNHITIKVDAVIDGHKTKMKLSCEENDFLISFSNASKEGFDLTSKKIPAKDYECIAEAQEAINQIAKLNDLKAGGIVNSFKTANDGKKYSYTTAAYSEGNQRKGALQVEVLFSLETGVCTILKTEYIPGPSRK